MVINFQVRHEETTHGDSLCLVLIDERCPPSNQAMAMEITQFNREIIALMDVNGTFSVSSLNTSKFDIV